MSKEEKFREREVKALERIAVALEAIQEQMPYAELTFSPRYDTERSSFTEKQ